jgi:hypothetical protein
MGLYFTRFFQTPEPRTNWHYKKFVLGYLCSSLLIVVLPLLDTHFFAAPVFALLLQL